MKTFTFTAKGQTFTVEAPHVREAFGQANRECDRRRLDLPQGAWMDSTAHPFDFHWAEGNFFD